jgi:hypothetical protein
MAWSEIGLDADDYPRVAAQLRTNYASWDEIDDIILGDVLGSFAPLSLLPIFVLIPVIGLFLIAPFPDWGYEKSYIERRIEKWSTIPRWQHYLNPIRVLGYPAAFLFTFSLRRKLRAAYHSVQT